MKAKNKYIALSFIIFIIAIVGVSVKKKPKDSEIEENDIGVLYMNNLKDLSEYVSEYDTEEVNYIMGKIEKIIRESVYDSIEPVSYVALLSEHDAELIGEALGQTLNELEDMISSAIDRRKDKIEFVENSKIQVSDEDVWELIDSQRQAIQNTSNHSDYLAYLEGTELTEDEYWESVFDIYKYSLIQKK